MRLVLVDAWQLVETRVRVTVCFEEALAEDAPLQAVLEALDDRRELQPIENEEQDASHDEKPRERGAPQIDRRWGLDPDLLADGFLRNHRLDDGDRQRLAFDNRRCRPRRGRRRLRLRRGVW